MPKLNEIKAGDTLKAGGGFTCIHPAATLVVHSDPNTVQHPNAAPGHGLYVDCAMGKHYLDGQAGDDGELVGFKRTGA